MPTVRQPTIRPTNKLTASVLAVAAVEVTRAFVNVWWPEFGDPALWAALPPAAALAIGYWVNDEDNTP